jgi:hypothetical protein
MLPRASSLPIFAPRVQNTEKNEMLLMLRKTMLPDFWEVQSHINHHFNGN